MRKPINVLSTVLPVLLLTITLCGHSEIQAATLPDTAKLLPPGTAVLAELGDFSMCQEQYRRTTFFSLVQDPAMKEFVENGKARIKELIEKEDDEFLKTILSLETLPEGRVAIALVLDKDKVQNSPAEGMNVLVIVQWGDSIDKVKEAVGKILARASEQDVRVQREDYRGLGITTVGQDPAKDMSYSIDGDCLMASTDTEVLKFAIAHLKGATSATLADESDYVDSRKSLAPYSPGQLAVFVNIRHVLSTQLATPQAGMAKVIAANLGLDNIVSLSAKIGPGPLASSASAYSYGTAFLRVDGDKKGICRILDLESTAVAAPRFVTADVLSMILVNIDIKKAFDEIYKIAAGFSPQVAALLNMPLLPPSPQGDPGVTIRGDVVGHLGSQIVVTQRVSEDTEAPFADASSIRTSDLIAIAVTNRSELERSVSRLHSQFFPSTQSQTTRELLGHTMYLIDVSMFIPGARSASRSGSFSLAGGQLPPGSAPAAPAAMMALAITDTHVLFGPEREVERAIRLIDASGQDSLGQARWFIKARSQMPSVAGMAAFENTALSGKMLWQMLKEITEQQKEGDSGDTTISLKIGSSRMFPTLMTNALDFSLLPDFEAVKKYFGLSVTYAVSRPDGFLLDLKYVEPD